ncbi:MAG: hypothetical protein GWN99_14990 [Gemmatimonadetes bacterium]|uniref:Type 4 fimbrial biogenesis protein PilX N-terminal domain-containing protein n=1 Tax=Candidatus Kutchimonas denitrificans TaxID=3056748 RepID=A0AAE4ZDE7_9BACT|nr:hypothetical protein [Gemmatimonadota bacterium]NIR76330.1 hypothetical protein [Candidatus Kutchimonas denitrificans]NIS02353.1 hypothetical protein [Gemmatimonadota bacterium]NIT68172.1 hypothetical protein [Gemmatimonadota bacterium]NIU54396.1 hypothetical protein [Gemmatimonadota bacterium]
MSRPHSYRLRSSLERRRKATFSRATADRRGLALIATLLIVVLVAIVIAAAVSSSMTVRRTTSADYQSTRAFYAAEAGAEAALVRIEEAVQDGVIEDSELADMTPPTLPGFEFTEYVVAKDGAPFREPLSDGPFAGMYSLTQNLTITSKATDPTGAHGAVVLGAKAQAIPIFQFAVFFEGGFVDDAGSRKDMIGRVHSNQGFYLSGCDLHFHKTMTTPGGIYRDGFTSHESISGDASDPCGIHVFLKDGSNNDKELTFDSADTPDPEQFKAKAEADFQGKLRTGAFGTDSLNLPLPDGVPPHELIRPRDGDDGTAEKATKFAWKADMYVSVDLTTHVDPAMACGAVPPPGLPALIPDISVVRYDGGTPLPDDMKCHIFHFKWEAFFDNAEEGWVDVLDIDIGQLNAWDASYPVDYLPEIIYVEFINGSTSNSSITDPHSDGEFNNGYFPILRIRNGAQLPGPLTVGSEYPLFVMGDYNTINWQPAALFGDRLAVLSNAWDDSHWANQGDNEDNRNPNADDTSQYFAVITGVGEGNLGCFHEDPACTTALPYGGSGWVKMLEDWKACSGGPDNGRCVHTMIGSFISLYAPQHASPWGGYPGTSYYRRPVRNWSFDTKFETPENLPPGTPVVGQVFRAAFRESY